MSENDSSSNQQQNAQAGVVGEGEGALDEENDEGSSLLAEVMASGHSVQIMRKPSNNRQRTQGLLGFFGVEDDQVPPEDVVTADMASIQRLSAERKKLQQQKQQLLEDAKNNKAAAGGETGKRRGRRGTRRIGRSNTFDGVTGEFLRSRRNARMEQGSSPVRAMSPQRATYRAPTSGANRRYTLQRAESTDGATTPTGKAAFRPSVAANYFYSSPGMMENGGGSDFYDTPPTPFSGTGSRHSSDSSASRSRAYSEHEDTIKRLTIQDDDIQKILQDPQAFAKLQKVLRKHGAVTNEVLRQVLPLYVKHQASSPKQADNNSTDGSRSSNSGRNRPKRDSDGRDTVAVPT